PFTGANGRQRVADHLAIANDRRALGDIDECRLVALRHEGAQFQAAWEARPRRKAEIVDDDRDIVPRIEPYGAGLLGHAFPFAHRGCSFSSFLVVMPGHSCSKNGVAFARYVPDIHVFPAAKTWMAGTSPAMTSAISPDTYRPSSPWCRTRAR